jgi:YaiO family outer membrane protein
MMLFKRILGVTLAGLAHVALAQQDPLALKMTGFVEFGVTHHSLSSGLGHWNGQYVRGNTISGSNTWHGDLWNWSQFGDHGTYVALGNTHVWNPDWHSHVTVGTSTGAFYLPDFRLDAFLSRKLLADRSLVLTIGFGMYDAKDEHRDRSLFVGATYYATPAWIFDGGVRWNHSDPGDVSSSYQHLAVTYGRNKDQFLTARYGWGREAYQLIGPTVVISDFSSRVGSVVWRKWLSPNWGLNLRGERYLNPTYSRSGVDVALFLEY